jgi:hypothetical protein
MTKKISLTLLTLLIASCVGISVILIAGALLLVLR